MSKQRIQLVTRADDAGSCNSANVAIWNSYRQGIVLNASVMVPAPAFEEAAELLGSEEGLCVGLHATLTSEWESVRWGPVLPAQEVSSLVDEHGCFPRSRRALEDNGARLDEMLAEIEAQLEVARSHGLNIAYVDTHMSVRFSGGLEEPLKELARREGLVYGYDVPWLPAVQGEFANSVEEFIAQLEAADPGTYLAVGHPAYDRVDVRMFGEGIGVSRDWDRRMFTDPRVLGYCTAHGVMPIRYTEA